MNKQVLFSIAISALKLCFFLGTLLLVLAPSTARSQQFVAGDTIRVKPSGSIEPERKWAVEQPRPRWTEGTVVRVTPDTVWYQSSGNVSPISMDIANIQRPTHRDHRVAGAVIGGVVGGVVGALIGYSSFEPEYKLQGGFGASGGGFVCALNGCNIPQSNSRAGDTANVAIAVGGTAAIVGYLIGKAVGRWETVQLDQVAIAPGNLAVSMRIRR